MEHVTMEGRGPGNTLVSVVVPAYRMGAHIGQALGSVAAQTHVAWEVIVVDDHGPEDGTKAAVERFAAAHPDHRVEYIRHTANKGVSAARNTAIAASNGEFVAFLDPDDIWLVDHLSDLVQLAAKSAGCTVATGPVEIFNDTPGRAWSHKAWIEPWKTRIFPHSLALYNFVQPSASMVRRSAIEAVGGFDTDPALQHIEDYDLWIRLVEQGGQFAFSPRITSRYRKHAAAATANAGLFRDLAARLVRKHPQFFQVGLARSVWAMRSDLEQVAHWRKGFFIGTFVRLDELIDRLRKRFRASG